LISHLLFFTPIVLYLGAVVVITLTARSTSDDSSYFFASKRLNTFQALLSVVSSETSVATTVAFPASGYKGGYVLIWMLLGYIVGRTIVALFYLRALYDSSRLTIYQTMSGSHRILEGAYLLAKYISGGVRYFIGAYALQQLLGGYTAVWILVIAICVASYSLTGGLKAVVAMDQIQSALLVGTGIFLCVYFASRVTPEALPAAAVFDWDMSKYTFTPIAFLGGAVLSIGSHGTDQDMLLRVLSTKSFRSAQRSLILSGFAAATLILIFLTVGYLLRGVSTTPLDPKSPLADFVRNSDLPALKGLFLVLLAAAAMSSLDSTIHSTGAIWKSLAGSTRPGRYWSAFSMGIMILFAFAFIVLSRRSEDFLSLALGSMNYVNGGLIGIATVFTFSPKRLTMPGIVAGLIAGFATTTICDWGFAAPVPITFTVLCASSMSMLACLVAGLFARPSASRDEVRPH
jgi:SSS family solute:Na+ symporter